jgi:penicillin-binding protein 1A
MIDEFAKERRLFVPIDEIPDIVKHAFISAEDKNFYTHQGYDPRGWRPRRGCGAGRPSVRGASTITQQVMKNFLLSGTARRTQDQGADPREPPGGDAVQGRILELYLNEIFLGQNSYGVARRRRRAISTRRWRS